MRQRATAAIVTEGNILLFRRIKPQHEYYIFPGGGVDVGETPEDAVVREVREETTLAVNSARLLTKFVVEVPEFITIHTGSREEYVFLIEDYEGTPQLSGPEKERAGPDNQYLLEWKPISALGTLQNIYPTEVATFLFSALK